MPSQELIEQGEHRREAMLAFIRTFLAEEGYSPSIAEIGAAVGIVSPNAVRSHLQRMKEDKLIDVTPGVARSIRLVSAA